MEIEINGKKIILKPLTVNDLVEFEEATGSSINNLQSNISIRLLRKLFWIAIKKTSPEITEEDIGSVSIFSSEWKAMQDFFLVGQLQ